MRNYTLVLLGCTFIFIAGKCNGSERTLEQAHALRHAAPILIPLEVVARPQEHTSLLGVNDTGWKAQACDFLTSPDTFFRLGSACFLAAIPTVGITGKLMWDRGSNSCPNNEAINILQTMTLSLVVGGLGFACISAHLKYRRNAGNRS